MTNPRFTAKIETEAPTPRLAVLIEADNAQAAIIKNLLDEIAQLGDAITKRIYGDFTSPQSASWKTMLNQFAIEPMQQFAYTKGKNATDCKLIIDAMDLLYTRRYDGFCLISSDSDFTGLAIRLKNEGLTVYGFGEKKTPEAFKNACHKFVFIEMFRPKESDQITPSNLHPEQKNEIQLLRPEQAITDELVTQGQFGDKKFLKKAIEQAPTSEDGWIELGAFGNFINRLKTDFDPRHYGYKKLSDLVKGHRELFVIEERTKKGSEQKTIYLKER